MEINSIKGAIFDVDGTVLDTMEMWHNSGWRYLNSIGVEADENLGDIYFSMTMDEVATHMIENFHLTIDREEIKEGINREVRNYYIEEAGIKGGAKELLDLFQENGIPMTVATSTDRHCLKPALDRLGLANYFKEIFTCSEVGKSKANPHIFHAARDVIDRNAEDIWVFEDGLYSMKTARNEGYKICGVYDRVSEKDQEEIRKLSDIYVKELGEFASLLELKMV